MSQDFKTTTLLRGEDSGGAVSIVDVTAPPGWGGPPLHHHDFDEAIYVLDGTVTCQLGDELLTATSRQLLFAPAGAVHTIANLADEPARYLVVITPAGFERFFERMAAEAEGVEPPATALGPIPDATFVGPPIPEQADLGPARPVPDVPGRIKVVLRGAESAGRVSIMDNAVPGGTKGPPLHHHEFDEGFYVVDGEVTFQLGDEAVTRRAGELAFARGGVHHAFANRGDDAARQLIICTPAGFERYFQRIAAKEAGVDPPPEAMEPWPEVVTLGPRVWD
jgi:quercetin dioxygenase-like cupin family protein